MCRQWVKAACHPPWEMESSGRPVEEQGSGGAEESSFLTLAPGDRPTGSYAGGVCGSPSWNAALRQFPPAYGATLLSPGANEERNQIALSRRLHSMRRHQGPDDTRSLTENRERKTENSPHFFSSFWPRTRSSCA